MGACLFIFTYALTTCRQDSIQSRTKQNGPLDRKTVACFIIVILISRLDLLAFFAIAQRQMSECALNIFLNDVHNSPGIQCILHPLVGDCNSMTRLD